MYRLALYLMGKAQKAYANTSNKNASTYEEVKAPVLRQYIRHQHRDLSSSLACNSPAGPCKQVAKGVYYCQGCGGDDREGSSFYTPCQPQFVCGCMSASTRTV